MWELKVSTFWSGWTSFKKKKEKKLLALLFLTCKNFYWIGYDFQKYFIVALLLSLCVAFENLKWSQNVQCTLNLGQMIIWTLKCAFLVLFLLSWFGFQRIIHSSGHLILKVETKKLIILQLGKKIYLDKFGNSSQTQKKKISCIIFCSSLI